MRSANNYEIYALIKKSGSLLSSSDTARYISAFPEEVLDSLGHLSMSDDELSIFSQHYLAQRKTAVAGIYQFDFVDMDIIVFVMLPIKQCLAYTMSLHEKDYVVITLGLVELLRYEVTISLLQSYLPCAVEAVKSVVRPGLKDSSIDKVLKKSTDIFAFLQACAVRYFYRPGYLPQIERQLPVFLQQKISILLEPCILFILLHEVGHIRYRLNNPAGDELAAKSEFLMPEQMDEAKAEELYADRYALSFVPKDFSLSMIHGSLFFFNLIGYLETLFSKRQRHPHSVNRINELYNMAKQQGDTDQSAIKAIEGSLANSHDFLQSLDENHDFDKKRATIEKIIHLNKDNEEHLIFARSIGMSCPS